MFCYIFLSIIGLYCWHKIYVCTLYIVWRFYFEKKKRLEEKKRQEEEERKRREKENSNNNRFEVEGTSVKRNGAFWGRLNETEDNIIINAVFEERIAALEQRFFLQRLVLDKMSGNFEWTDSHTGTIVTWTRVQVIGFSFG